MTVCAVPTNRHASLPQVGDEFSVRRSTWKCFTAATVSPQYLVLYIKSSVNVDQFYAFIHQKVYHKSYSLTQFVKKNICLWCLFCIRKTCNSNRRVWTVYVGHICYWSKSSRLILHTNIYFYQYHYLVFACKTEAFSPNTSCRFGLEQRMMVWPCLTHTHTTQMKLIYEWCTIYYYTKCCKVTVAIVSIVTILQGDLSLLTIPHKLMMNFRLKFKKMLFILRYCELHEMKMWDCVYLVDVSCTLISVC